MLQQEVVDAVNESKFHVYAVSTVDEGIEILTGVEAGVKGEDGAYPENSINYKVDKKLKEMAARLRQFAAPPAEEKKAAGVLLPNPIKYMLTNYLSLFLLFLS
jgi:predicted ATP-dependent protease